MGNISNILISLTQSYKSEILEYYNKYYSYIKDLYKYKTIDLKAILSKSLDDGIDKGISSMIVATNSALKTIGIPAEELNSESELYKSSFKEHGSIITDYESFFNISLKPYINSFLFKIILVYVMGIDKVKIQNLDLFDLLPKNFISKLNQFKKQHLDLINDFQDVHQIENIEKYFDATDFSIDLEKLKTLEIDLEEVSNINILNQLKEAKRENIEVLNKTSSTKILYDNKSNQKKLSFLDYFGRFPLLKQEIIEKLKINADNLLNDVEELLLLFDLENLFYFISILKMLGVSNPIPHESIFEILKNFISGKVFSTGKYHKPNPISNLFGLSILSELRLINQIEFIDPLDIEMFLENELKNFLPEKLSLNFYSLLSLKVLERNGGVITAKNALIKPLIDLDLFALENKNFPIDMFYHISLLKLIDYDINLNIFKNIYNIELKKLISPKGLVNDNLTDTARALLIFNLLELTSEEYTTVNTLLNNLIHYSKFFNDDIEEDFNWKNNKLALKVELRMLFWTLLASLQYSS